MEMDPPGFRPLLRFEAAVQTFFIRVFGTEHFTKICRALSRPSLYSCVRVNTLETSKKEVVIKLLEILKSNCCQSNYSLKDVCRCNDIKISMIHEGPQTVADVSSSDENAVSNGSPLENIIMIQGDGPHNINYTCDSGVMKEVLVSRKCAEAVLRGANVFVPGILACSGHVEQNDIVAVSVAVEHLDKNGHWVVGVTRGTVLLSGHGNSQLSNYERNHWYIGKGKAMLSRTAMFREPQGVAVEMIDRVYKLPPLHGVLKGEIFLQNLPSIVTAMALDPKPGERILDMCAAPGGKTTALAIIMKDKGEIIAIDRSHSKVAEITRLAEEMKLTCVHAYKVDALKSVQTEGTFDNGICFESLPVEVTLAPVSVDDCLPAPMPRDSSAILKSTNLDSPIVSESTDTPGKDRGNSHYRSNAECRKKTRKLKNGPRSCQNHVSGVKGFFPQIFDRVLLDPPCSALGLRPRLFAGEETVESLKKHGIYQRRMLDQAVQLCRPGGVIVYSTCTINPGENEAVVRYALDTYSFLTLVPQAPRIGGPGLTGGLDVFDGISSKEWLREEEKHLVQRFDPTGPLDTIGFFIAKFQVNSSQEFRDSKLANDK